MSIKSDRWIRQMSLEHHMIEPFEQSQVRSGAISYGVSSYGYDMRVAPEFRNFTNVHSSVVSQRAAQDPAARSGWSPSALSIDPV